MGIFGACEVHRAVFPHALYTAVPDDTRFAYVLVDLIATLFGRSGFPSIGRSFEDVFMGLVRDASEYLDYSPGTTRVVLLCADKPQYCRHEKDPEHRARHASRRYYSPEGAEAAARPLLRSSRLARDELAARLDSAGRADVIALCRSILESTAPGRHAHIILDDGSGDGPFHSFTRPTSGPGAGAGSGAGSDELDVVVKAHDHDLYNTIGETDIALFWHIERLTTLFGPGAVLLETNDSDMLPLTLRFAFRHDVPIVLFQHLSNISPGSWTRVLENRGEGVPAAGPVMGGQSGRGRSGLTVPQYFSLNTAVTSVTARLGPSWVSGLDHVAFLLTLTGADYVAKGRLRGGTPTKLLTSFFSCPTPFLRYDVDERLVVDYHALRSFVCSALTLGVPPTTGADAGPGPVALAFDVQLATAVAQNDWLHDYWALDWNPESPIGYTPMPRDGTDGPGGFRLESDGGLAFAPVAPPGDYDPDTLAVALASWLSGPAPRPRPEVGTTRLLQTDPGTPQTKRSRTRRVEDDDSTVGKGLKLKRALGLSTRPKACGAKLKLQYRTPPVSSDSTCDTRR